MAISISARRKIRLLIHKTVVSYAEKAKTNPKKNSGNPFTTNLLKDFDPIMHRVHGFKTSLGGVLEQIAEIIAVDAWGRENVRRKTNRSIRLPINVYQTINDIVSGLNNKKTYSNYAHELKQIIEAKKNASEEFEEQTYEFDLEIIDREHSHHYFIEMKGPDPNTTEVPGAKRRLLAEYAWGLFNGDVKNYDSFFGIYYNNKYPKDYSNKKVMYYFEPAGLLVHDEFWNFVGKDKKTFKQLVSIFDSYGTTHNQYIWEAFSALVGSERETG